MTPGQLTRAVAALPADLVAGLLIAEPALAIDIVPALMADDGWLPRDLSRPHFRASWFPRGLVTITEEEFAELGIPEAARRGHFDTRFCYRVQVDRRCLKRYRRRAGLRP